MTEKFSRLVEHRKKKKLPKPQNDVFDRKTSRKIEIPQVTTLFRAKFYAEQAGDVSFWRFVMLQKISIKNRFLALADYENET